MKKHIRSANDRMIALIILIALTIVAIGGTLGIVAMRDYNIYNDGGEYAWTVGRNITTESVVNEIEEAYYTYLMTSGYTSDQALPVLGNTGYADTSDARISESIIKRFSAGNCNFAFKVKDASDTVVWYNFDPAEAGNAATENGKKIVGTSLYQYSPVYGCTYYIMDSGITQDNHPAEGEVRKVTITIEIYVLACSEDGRWPASDDYSTIHWWIMTAAKCRYIVFAVIAVSALIIFVLLVMITNGAGLTADPDSDEIVPGFIDRVPPDMAVVVATGIIIAALVAIRLSTIANAGIVIENVVALAVSCVIMIIIVNILETISVHIKLGNLGRSTLVYKAYDSIRRKVSGKETTVKKGFLSRLSYTGRLVTAVVSLSFLILAFLSYFSYRYFVLGASQMKFEYFIIITLAAMIIIVPLIIMFVTNFGYIRDAGQRIASGDLGSEDISSQLSIKAMRDHGENLDHIKRDMAKAIAQEMKDERFRNELISNLSHDIRTPLTSINSFVELLSDENITEDQRKEYMEILHRQVTNLNSLTKNLMDISKFSTGNVEVHLEYMDAGVVVEQMIGECYFDLKQNNIETEISKEDKEYPVMADGEMLGRVVINLMSNIKKYAMPGTRAYIRLSEENGKISIMFRNVSKEIPEMSGEELAERFVRGDRSRHTDGSGLGLSIAKSLAELQHAAFNVEVDGDLFAVIITFDKAITDSGEKI